MLCVWSASKQHSPGTDTPRPARMARMASGIRGRCWLRWRFGRARYRRHHGRHNAEHHAPASGPRRDRAHTPQRDDRATRKSRRLRCSSTRSAFVSERMTSNISFW